MLYIQSSRFIRVHQNKKEMSFTLTNVKPNRTLESNLSPQFVRPAHYLPSIHSNRLLLTC